MLPHSKLKARHRTIRAGLPEALNHRVHRALSWLGRSEAMGDTGKEDRDTQFILLWIGFNSAYADDRDLSSTTERGAFRKFFETLVELDKQKRIHAAVWDLYTDEIERLFDNKYVFQPFWLNEKGEPDFQDWEQRFANSRRSAGIAIKKQDTAKVLQLVFDRLYTLRNQIMHGGATWNGSVNREQVNDGAAILAWLMPIFLDVMMGHPEKDWGGVVYPNGMKRRLVKA